MHIDITEYMYMYLYYAWTRHLHSHNIASNCCVSFASESMATSAFYQSLRDQSVEYCALLQEMKANLAVQGKLMETLETKQQELITQISLAVSAEDRQNYQKKRKRGPDESTTLEMLGELSAEPVKVEITKGPIDSSRMPILTEEPVKVEITKDPIDSSRMPILTGSQQKDHDPIEEDPWNDVTQTLCVPQA